MSKPTDTEGQDDQSTVPSARDKLRDCIFQQRLRIEQLRGTGNSDRALRSAIAVSSEGRGTKLTAHEIMATREFRLADFNQGPSVGALSTPHYFRSRPMTKLSTCAWTQRPPTEAAGLGRSSFRAFGNRQRKDCDNVSRWPAYRETAGRPCCRRRVHDRLLRQVGSDIKVLAAWAKERPHESRFYCRIAHDL